MVSASLYITLCSARNRIRVRLRRLREPRYLLGTIAGIAYFYFAVFARMLGPRRSSSRRRSNAGPPAAMLAAISAAGPAVVGSALMVLAAIAWVLPINSGLLEFTEAEIQFLFPAPVTRRQLLMHRLMRSQLGILFGSIVFGLFVPNATGLTRLRLSVATWLLFVTGKVYYTGISLTRARLASAKPAARRAALAQIVLLMAVLAVGGVALARAFLGQPVEDVSDALTRLASVVTNGPAQIVFFPFVALARPLFAQWPWPFFIALLPAALVMLAAVAWVLHADEALEDAANAASERRAAAARARTTPASSARAVGWTLALHGRAEGVFLWKNAMQVARATSAASLIRYIVPLTIVAISLSTAMMSRGAAMTLCTMAIGVAAFTVILGPQIMRLDLRDDLRHLELLKTWPLKPAAVLRGEMLCPGAVLTGIAWVAITCAGILSAAGLPRLSLAWRVSGAMTAGLLAPALVFAQLTVHNAAAVLFPAWVPLGNSRARGVDAMGQRLIMLGAVLLTLAVMLAPGIIAGAILWVAFGSFLGPAVLIPGALVCLGIVAIEVLAATEALAPAYEKLDIMAVERAE